MDTQVEIKHFTVVSATVCTSKKMKDFTILLVLISFWEQTQEIQLGSPDRFSPEGAHESGTRLGMHTCMCVQLLCA